MIETHLYNARYYKNCFADAVKKVQKLWKFQAIPHEHNKRTAENKNILCCVGDDDGDDDNSNGDFDDDDDDDMDDSNDHDVIKTASSLKLFAINVSRETTLLIFYVVSLELAYLALFAKQA